jgi:hypothetical protein
VADVGLREIANAPGPVLCGVDGSPASLTAVRLGRAVADHLVRPLVAVRAAPVPMAGVASAEGTEPAVAGPAVSGGAGGPLWGDVAWWLDAAGV